MTRSNEDAGPFPRKITPLVATIAALALIGSFVSLIVNPGAPITSVGPDSTSPSALGHRALLDLLRASEVPVVVTRHDPVRRTGAASLLLLIEPEEDEIGPRGARLSDVIRSSQCPVLLVLPKWRPHEKRDQHVLDSVSRKTPDEVERVLAAADEGAHVVGAEPGPRAWVTNVHGLAPEISDLQLFAASGWSPILGLPEGALVAQQLMFGHVVTVLSDPDLIANHGLHRGGNAKLVLELFRGLRTGGGPVIVDETLHGYSVPESFWAQLFTFPLALATAQAALAVALLLWAGVRRFGAPEKPRPPFDPGTRFLTEHTAKLLETARHHGEALVRYGALLVEETAKDLHGGGGADVRAKLARIEGRRKTTDTLAELEHEADTIAKNDEKDGRAVLRHARRMRTWQQEMVDGPNVSPGVR